MNSYDQRSRATELIDAPDIPFSNWETCLKELNAINTWLGGHRITIDGVRRLLPVDREALTIAEIGCGGGDNLLAIHRWNKNKKHPIHYTGIDLNAACIEFAHGHCRELPDAFFQCSDYRLAVFPERPGVIFSSLFCHHFTDDELVEMLTWLKENASIGFFINDLHRHPLAYHSIKLLTALFSRSYLVRNDAPISVLRGFKRREWKTLLRRAGITNYSIRWKWAFRYLVIVNNE